MRERERERGREREREREKETERERDGTDRLGNVTANVTATNTTWQDGALSGYGGYGQERQRDRGRERQGQRLSGYGARSRVGGGNVTVTAEMSRYRDGNVLVT